MGDRRFPAITELSELRPLLLSCWQNKVMHRKNRRPLCLRLPSAFGLSGVWQPTQRKRANARKKNCARNMAPHGCPDGNAGQNPANNPLPVGDEEIDARTRNSRRPVIINVDQRENHGGVIQVVPGLMHHGLSLVRLPGSSEDSYSSRPLAVESNVTHQARPFGGRLDAVVRPVLSSAMSL